MPPPEPPSVGGGVGAVEPPAGSGADPAPVGAGALVTATAKGARGEEETAPVVEAGDLGSDYSKHRIDDAVLAGLVEEIYAIERIKPLLQQARKRMRALKLRNVQLRHGDGYEGWPSQAPFDGIIVTAAPERVPDPLLEQLAEGGLIVIPVGSPYFVQTLMLVQKRDGKPYATSLMPVRFVPFTRASE